jgi:hypothetical protein
MPSGNARLVVEVVAASGQFQADLGKAAAVAAAQAKKIERSIDDLKKSTLDFGRTALAAFGISLGAEGIIRAFESVKDATIAEERSLNQLQAVLTATGNAAGLTAQQLKSIGSGIQSKSIFDDDAIRQAEVALLRFRSVQGDVFKQAIQLTPDVATVLGTDLPTAAQALGRALTDPETGMRALRAAGINLSEQQKDLAARLIESGDKLGAMKIVLDEVAKSVGGSSEADTKGLYGSTKRLARAWNDLEKAAGKKIFGDNHIYIDALTGAFEALAKKVDDTDLSFKHLFARAVLPPGFIGMVQMVAGAFGGKPTPKGAPAGIDPGEQARAIDANMAAEAERARQAQEQLYLDQQAAIKKRAANAATYYQGELSRTNSFINEFNAELSAGYDRGTVTIEDFFNEQKKLAEASFEATAKFLGEQGLAQEAVIGALSSSRDEREAARAKLQQIANAHDDALYAKNLKILQLTEQQKQAVERLSDSYKELHAAVLEAEGDPVQAAGLAFEAANRQRRTTLETQASRGTPEDRAAAQQALNDLNRQKELAVQRASDSVRNTVDDITEQLLTLQGNTAAATALHLRDANSEIRRQLTFRGDTQTLARLDEIERLSVAQARLNDLQGAYNLAVDELGVKQGRIDLQLQQGSITELDSINARADAAKQYANALRPVVEAWEAVAQKSGDPRLIVQAEQYRLALERLEAQADELRKKFEDVFTGSFTDALASIVDGTKSVKDAFKDMAKSIEQQITKIAAQDVAERLFNKGGLLGGLPDFLSKAFGGKGSDQSNAPSSPVGGFLDSVVGGFKNLFGGGSSASSFGMNDRGLGLANGGTLDVASLGTLTSAGTILSTSGSLLTSAGTLLTTAATELSAAAAALSASAGASGGGGLGSIFGGGSSLFGSNAIDVGDNFAGGIPFYASGTDFHPGGLAVVGERGAELVNLPRGAQVIPNDVLRAKRAERQGNSVTIHSPITVNVQGNVSSATANQIAVEVTKRQRRTLASGYL